MFSLSSLYLDGQKAFSESMLDYMPRWHREFVLYVRNGPSVRDYGKLCNFRKSDFAPVFICVGKRLKN